MLDAAANPAHHHCLPATPGQAFNVALQYPLAMAGEEVVADPVDGGRIDGRPSRKLKVGRDGQLLFTFTAGQNTGSYQVGLRSEQGSASLEFWVAAVPTR